MNDLSNTQEKFQSQYVTLHWKWGHTSLSMECCGKHRIQDGVSITDFYRFDEVLGEGTFSVVYLGESKAEKDGWVAIKVVRKHVDQDDEEADAVRDNMIDREIRIMSLLDHPHIVHLNEVYDEEDNVCFVMELAKGGEVFDRLMEAGRFSEAQTASLVVQLLCAMSHVHSRGLVHRDLKLENLLYYDDAEDSKILVADFGLSDWVTEVETLFCGTPGYMAPEVVRRQAVTAASDVWSIGVITYILLGGYPPFYSDTDDSSSSSSSEDQDQKGGAPGNSVLRRIAAGDYRFDGRVWRNVSGEAKDFIRSLMCVDAARRPTCDEALAHPWLRHSQTGRPAPPSSSPSSWAQSLSYLFSVALVVLVYATFMAYLFSV